MDALFGFTGADFVLIAGDAVQLRSIFKLKDNLDKLVQLDEHKILACAGPNGDVSAFSDFILRNMELERFRNHGQRMSTHATANFTRHALAQALRRSPYQVNMLIGGYDKNAGPSLYFMDYLASMQKVTRGAQGYIAYFVNGLLDRLWKEGMTQEEGLEVARKCVHEIKKRFLVDLVRFQVKIITADGIKSLELESEEIEELSSAQKLPTGKEQAEGAVAMQED
ncbi:MAG: hypothetical protein MHM6MM_000979 [Cercozoa sp. M6MM]